LGKTEYAIKTSVTVKSHLKELGIKREVNYKDNFSKKKIRKRNRKVE